MPTPMLAVCCMCKRVSSDDAASPRWTTMQAYLAERQLEPVNVQMSHTYCPLCYERQAQSWALSPSAPRAA